MNKRRKKVAYQKPSKRNPMQDIPTGAARRAKVLAAERAAELLLRSVLDHPTNPNGKPVAAHLVTKIAAERLQSLDGWNHSLDFDFAAKCFLARLKYEWGCAIGISSFWKSFLELVAEADSDCVTEFARNYAAAFRWCLAGHVHRLDIERDKLPDSIQFIEIRKTKTGRIAVGVQRDGIRRIMPSDRPPDFPTICFAGSKTHHFIAPKDLMKIEKLIQKLGQKAALAKIESGKFKLSPRPMILVDEDTVLNVCKPSADDLAAIRSLISTLGFKPTRRTKLGS